MTSVTIATGLLCFISISEMELAVRVSAAKLLFGLFEKDGNWLLFSPAELSLF